MREKILYYNVHEVHDSQAQNAVVISPQTCDYAVHRPSLLFFARCWLSRKKKKPDRRIAHYARYSPVCQL